MKRRTQKIDWTFWERQVCTCAEAMAHRHRRQTLPIPLGPIARDRRVHRYVFDRLPVAGGIAVEENGFVIYVNCEPADAPSWYAKLADESDGGATLPVRARFTIAHEIAHTFFYDLSTGPKSLLSQLDAPDLSRLERLCNVGAAQMQISDRDLRIETELHDILIPTNLLQMARRFRVSLVTLVVRLTRFPGWSWRGGAIFIVSKRGNTESAERDEQTPRYWVSARAIDGTMRAFLGTTSPRSLPPDASRSLDRFGLDGGDLPDEVTIPCRVGGVDALQPCGIHCAAVNEDGCFMITMRLSGQPTRAVLPRVTNIDGAAEVK